MTNIDYDFSLLYKCIINLRFRADTHIWWLLSLKDQMFSFNDSKVPDGFEISLNKEYLKKVSLCIEHESQVMSRFLDEFITASDVFDESGYDRVDFMRSSGSGLIYLYFRLSIIESIVQVLHKNLTHDGFFNDEINLGLSEYFTCISRTREFVYRFCSSCSSDILFTSFFPDLVSPKTKKKTKKL